MPHVKFVAVWLLKAVKPCAATSVMGGFIPLA